MFIKVYRLITFDVRAECNKPSLSVGGAGIGPLRFLLMFLELKREKFFLFGVIILLHFLLDLKMVQKPTYLRHFPSVIMKSADSIDENASK